MPTKKSSSKSSPGKAAKPSAKSSKKTVAKSVSSRKPASKKAATAKKPVPKPAAAKRAVASKSTAKKVAPKKKAPAAKPKSAAKSRAGKAAVETILPQNTKTNNQNLSAFQKKQWQKLLTLRDTMLDSMSGVAKDTLRARAEGSEASAFGMHQADAGSDAYDRDFALNLLSQEQDALYEIDEAIKRLENGTYGICEMSGKSIPKARLEAIPFARFTVECQSQLEKENRANRPRYSVTSLFGLTDSDSDDDDDDSLDNKN